MTIQTPVGNKLNGFFRGKVIKHLKHGKCKVWIPSIYDPEWETQPDMLPDAEQAAPLFAGSNHGNGCFSYPNIGAIVWCFFQNGDQNYPVIFASSLGGENAFNQYNSIKTQYQVNQNEKLSTDVISDEDISLTAIYNPDSPDPTIDISSDNHNEHIIPEQISKRHLITSGNSHLMMYENGQISAVVSTPYDKDVEVNTISKNINNDVKYAVDNHQISSKHCEFVMTDVSEFGSISSMTEYYSPFHEYGIVELSDEQIRIVSNLVDYVTETKHDNMNDDGSEQLDSHYIKDYKYEYSKQQTLSTGQLKTTILYDKIDIDNELSIAQAYGGNTVMHNIYDVVSSHNMVISIDTHIDSAESIFYKNKLSNLLSMSDDSCISLKTIASRSGFVDPNTGDTYITLDSDTEHICKAGNIGENITYSGSLFNKDNIKYQYDNVIKLNKNAKNGANYTLTLRSVQTKNNTPEHNAIYKHDMSMIDGMIEISLVDNMTKHSCTIRLDKHGVMNITTDNKINIESRNQVNISTQTTTIDSPQIVLNGNTTVKGTMHITGATTIDSNTKIASDANIAGKSFVNHRHYSGTSTTSIPV